MDVRTAFFNFNQFKPSATTQNDLLMIHLARKDFDRATALALTMKDKNEAFKSIISHCLPNSRETAMNVLSNMDKGLARQSAAELIADSALFNNEMDLALKVADETGKKDYYIAQVSHHQEIKDPTAALETISLIEDSATRDSLYDQLTVSLRVQGKISLALETVSRISSPDKATHAFNAIWQEAQRLDLTEESITLLEKATKQLSAKDKLNFFQGIKILSEDAEGTSDATNRIHALIAKAKTGLISELAEERLEEMVQRMNQRQPEIAIRHFKLHEEPTIASPEKREFSQIQIGIADQAVETVAKIAVLTVAATAIYTLLPPLLPFVGCLFIAAMLNCPDKTS